MMNDANKHAHHLPLTSRKLRFGSFEVDLDLREVRNRGIRIRLQHKPFQVLELLLQNPGSLVKREDLMQQLWPNLHVNFDGGLNTAVNALRQVLGDSPHHCRFIETLPGLGYRFLVPVEILTQADPGRQDSDRRTGGRITSFKARQDCLKGKHFYNKLSEDDLRKSIAYFESAIEQDAGFAPAYAGLADAYCLCALLGVMAPADARRRAQPLTTTALQIDRELPEARVSLANVKKLFDRDWRGAEAECLRALESNPKKCRQPPGACQLLAVTGRVQEALDEIRHAQTLDPLSAVISVELACILYLARDFQGAIEEAWRVLILEPTFAVAQHTLGLAYEQTGMISEAIAEFQNARACSGHSPAAIAALGHAYSLAGKQGGALPNTAGTRRDVAGGLFHHTGKALFTSASNVTTWLSRHCMNAGNSVIFGCSC